MQDEKERPTEVDAQPDKPKKATSVGGGEKASAYEKSLKADAKPEPDETPEDKKLPD